MASDDAINWQWPREYLDDWEEPTQVPGWLESSSGRKGGGEPGSSHSKGGGGPASQAVTWGGGTGFCVRPEQVKGRLRLAPPLSNSGKAAEVRIGNPRKEIVAVPLLITSMLDPDKGKSALKGAL